MKMYIDKYKIGDICLIDLPECGKYCLNGKHKCVICKKSGSNYIVAPISSNRKKLKLCEYAVEKGRCGMDRDSKIKLDQIRPVSEELIIHKFKDSADRDILRAIGNYFIEEAREIYRIDLAA